jgi:dephospho-CoA kinase
MKGKYPLLVGVTGGLGSGKSTVCRYLSELGCRIFEADHVAKDLQVSDQDIIASIRSLFGNDIYAPDAAGRMVPDRKKMASIVFSSPEKLAALNSIVHPGVFREFHRAVAKAAEDGVPILVKEAAILFESGADKGLDVVVVVTADKEKRIDRAVQKGLGSRDEIAKRISVQWSQEKLAEKADFVIKNNGTEEELKRETDSLYAALLRIADSACDGM